MITFTGHANIACPLTLSPKTSVFTECTSHGTNVAHGMLVSGANGVMVLAHLCGRRRFSSLYGGVSRVLKRGWRVVEKSMLFIAFLFFILSPLLTGGGPHANGRTLFKGRCTACRVASGRLDKTYFCLIDNRKNPSPKTVNVCRKHRLRRSRCTCSVVLQLTHRLLSHNTGIRVVVRSGGSNVHSNRILTGDGHRAYVKSPVPLGRITHLGRHYS